MESYGVAELRRRLSEILERVSQGEQILLTRRGKPVARLLPAGETLRSSILGAGRHDPNLNHEALAADDWWRPTTGDEVKVWYSPDAGPHRRHPPRRRCR